jgi:hypothetical protein
MNTRSLAAALTVCTMAFSSVPASASGPGREIRIHEENFAKLSEAEQQRVLEVKDRLEAIQATDRSEMSREERKELRTEWKELKKEVNEINAQQPVIYISLTALLIIVLLIILL